MRIKKTKDRNEFINADGIWVRNFRKEGTPFIDINKMLDKEDFSFVLQNEIQNKTLSITQIDEEEIRFRKIIIVSDGYDFENKYKILKNLPDDVGIFAVNGSLSKWKLHLEEKPKAINIYIANNPYSDCLNYLPRETKYFPVCVASTRTNNDFVKKYQGRLYLYQPCQQIGFNKYKPSKYCIDDYRNPICASIGLAARFNVEKLMLFCCDDSFADERPAAIKLKNGLWTYPQQLKSQKIIDANLYWLKHEQEIEVADHSSCSEYVNAEYIISEDDVLEFFKD